MPQVGDVIRTRYCLEAWGRTVQLTFWWRLKVWNPPQRMDEFIFRNALNWLAAVDPWVDDSYAFLSGTARNLSRNEPDVLFPFYVTGVPKPRPVQVVQATIWVTRYGTDDSGNAKSSSFPISNCVFLSARGRLEGSGQHVPIIEFLTLDHFIVSPFFPVWEPGFISRTDGSFVHTKSAWINPVIKSMKKRTKRSSTRWPIPYPV